MVYTYGSVARHEEEVAMAADRNEVVDSLELVSIGVSFSFDSVYRRINLA